MRGSGTCFLKARLVFKAKLDLKKNTLWKGSPLWSLHCNAHYCRQRGLCERYWSTIDLTVDLTVLPTGQSSAVHNKVNSAVDTTVRLALPWSCTAPHSSPKAYTLCCGALGSGSLGHRGTVESTTESIVESTVGPTVDPAVESILESIVESMLESIGEPTALHSFPKARTLLVWHWGAG